jgi:molybdopterin molybdotransferase
MSARPIDEHRAAVEALLAGLFGDSDSQDGVFETLELSSDRVTADPDRYRSRTLAVGVVSPVSLPPFDNSQMDGYAVRSIDLGAASAGSPVHLGIAGRIAAGDPGFALQPGTAVPIMTGAPIPAGADAVVPIEQADPPRFLPATAGDEAGRSADGRSATDPSTTGRSGPGLSTADRSSGGGRTVSFSAPVSPGTFVRPTGSDVRAGDRLLAAGTHLGPAQLGVLAGTGVTRVVVRRRIRVLLIATGHEIREPGQSLAAGQIFDSNSVLLSQALQDAGCAVTARPCRSDDAADLLALLAGAAEADLVITVGGVSAGAREVVRDALGPLGVSFGHVAMQPGGPQGLGAIPRPGAGPTGAGPAGAGPTGAGPTRSLLPVVSFPGNPVSALISFEVFLRPVLRRLAGFPRPDRELRQAPLAAAVESPAGKHQLRRGILRPDGALDLVGGPSSHLLHAYASASALVHLPVGVQIVAAGTLVDYWSIDD